MKYREMIAQIYLPKKKRKRLQKKSHQNTFFEREIKMKKKLVEEKNSQEKMRLNRMEMKRTLKKEIFFPCNTTTFT